MNGPVVQFIVPTLRRVDYLTKCLESILGQTVNPASILVGVKDDDVASIQVVERFSRRAPVRRVPATGLGVVGSMSACLNVSTAEFVVLVDDDVELPPHWLDTMLANFHSMPRVVAVSGRDLLQDHPQMRASELLTIDVGRVHWYGRITGNHHRGAGVTRCVDVLRGSNVLFCGEFLRQCGFEGALLGKGAQVHWELALAFQARVEDRCMLYDPSVQVLHHTAPRAEGDLVHRGTFDEEGVFQICYNETFVTLKHAPLSLRWRIVLWQLLVGSRGTPGLVNAIRRWLHGEPVMPYWRATMKGRWRAFLGVRELSA